MAKDPAFLFYSSDFLSGVTFLTMEQRGNNIDEAIRIGILKAKGNN